MLFHICKSCRSPFPYITAIRPGQRNSCCKRKIKTDSLPHLCGSWQKYICTCLCIHNTRLSNTPENRLKRMFYVRFCINSTCAVCLLCQTEEKGEDTCLLLIFLLLRHDIWENRRKNFLYYILMTLMCINSV